MLELSEPRIIERGPYQIVGVYCPFEGEEEGPGWDGAYTEYSKRKNEIKNRTDDLLLGFLYRPHKDHPEIPENINTCFLGVEVTGFDHLPGGMATTQYSGGKYVIVECKSEIPEMEQP
jgi:hypothetical protein